MAAALPPDCGTGGPCLVFLSSTHHHGNLGGVTGADARCQADAAAAGLSGTYMAWITGSSSVTSPSSRFTRSTGPYQLVNGATVAANLEDLTDGNLTVPINVTEKGQGETSDLQPAWTNTELDGSRRLGGSDHCNDWKSNDASTHGHLGLVTRTTDLWTDFDTVNCANRAPLYCFQQS